MAVTIEIARIRLWWTREWARYEIRDSLRRWRSWISWTTTTSVHNTTFIHRLFSWKKADRETWKFSQVKFRVFQFELASTVDCSYAWSCTAHVSVYHVSRLFLFLFLYFCCCRCRNFPWLQVISLKTIREWVSDRLKRRSRKRLKIGPHAEWLLTSNQLPLDSMPFLFGSNRLDQ